MAQDETLILANFYMFLNGFFCRYHISVMINFSVVCSLTID